MITLTIFLNNGQRTYMPCGESIKADDVRTLAKQISNCALVNAVDCGIIRYRNGEEVFEK